MNREEFFDRIQQQVPEAKEVRDEHTAYWGELLTHLYMADIARLAEDLAAEPLPLDRFQTLLEVVEEGLKYGDDEVQNLVYVSFIENLIPLFSSVPFLREYAGPLIKQELERIF